MSSRPPVRPRHSFRLAFPFLLLGLLALLSASAVAQQQSPPPAAPAAQPDQIEWLTDAEGRQYRVEPMPKSQGVKIEGNRVRTMWGVEADLAREDEEFFYIKLYRIGARPPVTPTTRAARRPAAAEPLPRVSQRLRWTRYGTGLPAAGQWREGLALVDVTGDGRLDIAAGPARKTLRAPTMFVQDGTAWQVSKAFRYPRRPYDYGDITVGDFSGDGVLDLVLGVHLRGLIALRGTADGAFEDASAGLPFAAADEAVFSSRALLLADCSGDNRPDIIALGEGPRLPGGGAGAGGNANAKTGANASASAAAGTSQAAGADDQASAVQASPADASASGITSFVQQADGTWSAKPQANAKGLFGSSLASGDVDGDNRADVIVAPGILGDTRIVQRGDGACGWQAEPVEAVRPRSYVTAATAGDVDGDGRVEAIVGYMEFAGDQPIHGVDMLTRAADGSWRRRALLRAPGRVRIDALAAGDLDGDGHVDVAAAGESGGITVFLGDGRGAFTRERQVIPSAGSCQASSIAIGDLDRDGLADLVVGYAQESTPMLAGVCPGEGGIAAWRTQRAAGRPARRAAPPPAPRPR